MISLYDNTLLIQTKTSLPSSYSHAATQFDQRLKKHKAQVDEQI
jgi:hypothetical protein